ncbi:hypothetical protein BC427_04790 [Ralstonia solanacearum FJAT-91]|nr:hypothetical protein BC427_04790 [Ralstonia solanacearum FJAT-91]QKZ28549.1 hypothetical protein HWE45_13100 [Ralstonia solanacearum]QKZ33515.1 hypothetical protein HWE47_13090 [Ralstonia solanacearum]
MPITAFSKAEQRELDVEQWLAAMGAPHASARDIPEAFCAQASLDLECTACGAKGAVIVAGSKAGSKAQRQPHFRFTSSDGSNPHHELCDYFDEAREGTGEHLVDFSDNRSALTRAVRDLVCRGLAHGLFTQGQMRQMRLWFLQAKAAAWFRMDVTSEFLDWCTDMWGSQYGWGGHTHAFEFQPILGLLSNFQWENAARAEWVRQNQRLFELAQGRSVRFDRNAVARPAALARRTQGQLVFDASSLEEQYEAALCVAKFAANYLVDGQGGEPALPLVRKHHTTWGPAARILLALSALLLYLSGWDRSAAIALFVRLRVLPLGDWRGGNLIGLNPFHDFDAWRLLAVARQIRAARRDARPVKDQVSELVSALQTTHQEWWASQPAFTAGDPT